MTQPPDVLRLTQAIEHLKSLGWVNEVVTDDEWQPQTLQAEYAGTEAFLVRKSELVRQFAEDGRLTRGIEFMVVGNSRVVVDALSTRGLACMQGGQYADGCFLTLVPVVGTQEPIVQVVR